MGLENGMLGGLHPHWWGAGTDHVKLGKVLVWMLRMLNSEDDSKLPTQFPSIFDLVTDSEYVRTESGGRKT